MKTLVTIALVFWMLFTLILTCSVIGTLLFVPKDRYESHPNTPSTWMTVGLNLVDKLTNNER